MPPLKNTRKEKFARALTQSDTQTEAYMKAFNRPPKDVNRKLASRLASNVDVRRRFLELLEEQGIGLDAIKTRYAQFLHDDDNPVQSWDAVKTGLRIYGVLDDDKNVESGAPLAIQVNIIGRTEEGE